MEPQITSNTFCSYTASRADASTTVFFISGNPGLIGYYHPFLSLLGEYLANGSSQDQSSKKDSSIQIYGCSLGGFEVACDATPSTKDPRGGRARLYDLEDQIVFVHDKLNALMSRNVATMDDASESSAKRKVILMGHSVGAYIAMEVLRRHKEAIPESRPENEYTVDFDIIGGVMLFPTVKDIAHSPSGQKLTVRGFFDLILYSYGHMDCPGQWLIVINTDRNSRLCYHFCHISRWSWASSLAYSPPSSQPQH